MPGNIIVWLCIGFFTHVVRGDIEDETSRNIDALGYLVQNTLSVHEMGDIIEEICYWQDAKDMIPDTMATMKNGRQCRRILLSKPPARQDTAVQLQQVLSGCRGVNRSAVARGCEDLSTTIRCTAELLTTIVNSCGSSYQQTAIFQMVKLIETTTQFLCKNNGLIVNLFVSGMGVECFQLTLPGILQCYESAEKDRMKIPRPTSLEEVRNWFMIYLEKCRILYQFRDCIIREMRTCSNWSPAILVEIFFNRMLNMSTCGEKDPDYASNVNSSRYRDIVEALDAQAVNFSVQEQQVQHLIDAHERNNNVSTTRHQETSVTAHLPITVTKVEGDPGFEDARIMNTTYPQKNASAGSSTNVTDPAKPNVIKVEGESGFEDARIMNMTYQQKGAAAGLFTNVIDPEKPNVDKVERELDFEDARIINTTYPQKNASVGSSTNVTDPAKPNVTKVEGESGFEDAIMEYTADKPTSTAAGSSTNVTDPGSPNVTKVEGEPDFEDASMEYTTDQPTSTAAGLFTNIRDPANPEDRASGVEVVNKNDQKTFNGTNRAYHHHKSPNITIKLFVIALSIITFLCSIGICGVIIMWRSMDD